MLRKSRSHYYGFTNIDLRSKGDPKVLSLYQPWMVPKDFGTMGSANFKLPPDSHKSIFKVSNQLNSFQEKNLETPNPKYYSSCKYYQDNKLKINQKTSLVNERASQLDESVKGKEPFIGDSMMISDNIKIRKINKIKKGFGRKEKRSKLIRNENIIKEKKKQNEESLHETQLVSVEAEKTLEGKVDIKKLKEIRLVLRRKYGNKTDFRKIFKDWNLSVNGEITVYDAHKMINSFGIPINFNETRALIASSNFRETETLNLQEFIHLIFNDNPALNVDLSKLTYKDERLYSEGAQIEDFQKKMKISVLEKSKKDQIEYLEEFFRLKIPKLLKVTHENGCKEDFVDYNTFLKVMSNFSIPDHYYHDQIVKGLFDKYSMKNEQDQTVGMNLKKFAEYSMQKSLEGRHNFYQFKMNYLDTLEKKMIRSKSEVYSNRLLLLDHKTEQRKLLQEYLNEIEEKKNKMNKSQIISNEINSCQPSTAFLCKIFNKRELYHQQLDEVEKSFTAFPSLSSELKGKTRSGANPKPKNTFPEFQPDPSSSMYIDEKDRFQIRSLNDKVDFIHKEKLQKMTNQNGRLERINKNNQKIAQYFYYLDMKAHQADILSQASKTKMLYEHELKNKIRNEIIE